MADNIDITPGSGKTVATDEIGGFHFQKFKVTFGVDGTATEVSAISPFPVAIISGGGGGGDASAANQTTEIARLTSILNALAGTLAVSASALPLPSGAANQTKQDSIITALGLLGTAAQQTAAKAVFDQISTNTGNLVSMPTTLPTGQTSLTTTSATQLTGSSTPLVSGVNVKAPTTNTATVFIGLTGVTTGTGYPLAPGESTFILIDNLNKLFAITGTATQVVAWQGN